MMLAILRKDIEQNAKALALVTVVGLVISTFLMVLKEHDPKQGDSTEGFLFGALVLGMPIMFGMWLIGHEKMKGTILILKALPVGGVSIVLAKWLLSSVYSLLATFAVEILIPLFVYNAIPGGLGARLEHMAWIVSLSMLTTGLFFSIFTVLDQKLATQVSWISMSIIVFALGHLATMPAVQEFFKTGTGFLLMHYFSLFGWFLIILIGLIGVIFSGRYIDQNDMGTLQEF